MSNKKPQLTAEWLAHLNDEFEKDYMKNLRSFLVREKSQYKIYPPGNQIFNALNTTPLSNTNVVILGQDPYHGQGQAHGLCFSVNRGIQPPPSLQNIFQEIYNELGTTQPGHGDLSSWAQQGVLLLNTTLTVRAGSPRSHAEQGWETFTDKVIQVINEHRQGVIFLLWGRDAKAKQQLIDSRNHLVLTSSHPSPYSANYGFFGCGHFKKVNEFLAQNGKPQINWQLPP